MLISKKEIQKIKLEEMPGQLASHLHAPLAQLIWRFALGYHQFTDDIQIYLLIDIHLHSVLDILADALEVVSG